jgi:hypothetical protein
MMGADDVGPAEPAPKLEQFQNLPQPPPVRSIGDPWGNLAKLPWRPLPDYVRKEAEALREVRMIDRITLVELLIVNTRVMRGLMGLEDEILEFAGFPDGQYWRACLGRRCTPENYAFHLSRFFADPADPGYQGDILPVVPGNEPVKYGDMDNVQRLLRDALRRAYDIDEPFFPRTRKGITEIVTDDAGQWLLADPRHCELLPRSYRAFLERGGHAQSLPAPASGPAPEVLRAADEEPKKPGSRGRPRGAAPQLRAATEFLNHLIVSGKWKVGQPVNGVAKLVPKISISTLGRAAEAIKKAQSNF